MTGGEVKCNNNKVGEKNQTKAESNRIACNRNFRKRILGYENHTGGLLLLVQKFFIHCHESVAFTQATTSFKERVQFNICSLLQHLKQRLYNFTNYYFRLFFLTKMCPQISLHHVAEWQPQFSFKMSKCEDVCVDTPTVGFLRK